MNKVMAMLDLFRKGSAVDNPQDWKSGQITATMLGVAIVSAVHLAKAYGYDLPIDEESATTVAGGIIAVVNVILTMVTSKHAGFGAGQPTLLPTVTTDAVSTSYSEVEPVVRTEAVVQPVNETTIETTPASSVATISHHTSLFDNR